MTKVKITQTFRLNFPMEMPGKEASEAKLPKVGRADSGLSRKFHSALVSPRNMSAYRAM